MKPPHVNGLLVKIGSSVVVAIVVGCVVWAATSINTFVGDFREFKGIVTTSLATQDARDARQDQRLDAIDQWRMGQGGR